jgi:N-acetylglucosamine-6-phosphate deacetylase
MRLDRMITAARAIAEAEAPNIRGIHFEGPFLSPRRRGAQTESALLTPDDSVAKLRDTDTLAGSVHFLSDALANAVRLLGLTPPHAAPLVSTNPAHHYGWQNRGTVAVGNPADLVLLSDDLTVEAVYLAGRLARS